MLTIEAWIDKISPPKRTNAPYRVAKGLLPTSLSALDTSVSHLVSGQYQQFRNFLLNLNQILAILYSLTIYSRDAGDEAAATLTAQLANARAELEHTKQAVDNATETAEAAVEWKEKSEASANEAKQHAVEVEGTVSEAQNKLSTIQSTLETGKAVVAELGEIKHSAVEHKDTIEVLAKKADELGESIDQYEAKHHELMEHLETDQERIDYLLPQAASAGLASAFARRVDELKGPKRWWAIGFILGIFALGYLGIDITTKILAMKAADAEVWVKLLYRLPVLLPAIWFTWFSARRYSYAERIQEDYAHKEASARAFEGYKKQMKEVGLEGDDEMLKLLCERAIETYSKDPQRIYENKVRDVSPTSKMISDFSEQIGEKE